MKTNSRVKSRIVNGSVFRAKILEWEATRERKNLFREREVRDEWGKKNKNHQSTWKIQNCEPWETKAVNRDFRELAGSLRKQASPAKIRHRGRERWRAEPAVRRDVSVGPALFWLWGMYIYIYNIYRYTFLTVRIVRDQRCVTYTDSTGAIAAAILERERDREKQTSRTYFVRVHSQ